MYHMMISVFVFCLSCSTIPTGGDEGEGANTGGGSSSTKGKGKPLLSGS